MTYKATTYTAALAAAVVGLYSPTADATPRAQVAPYQVPAGSTLEGTIVSAGINLEPNQRDGRVVVRVGSDELPYQVNISVKKAGQEIPVCGYDVLMSVTPSTTASRKDPRDDIKLTHFSDWSGPKKLEGLEHDYRQRPTEANLFAEELSKLPSDGEYIVFTTGVVKIPVEERDCAKTVSIPAGSYDVFTVVGTKGTPVVSDDARVQEWRENPLIYTKGGWVHPRWNHLVYPEGIMQYEAGKNRGSHFAVMGTGKDPACEPKKTCTPEPCLTTAVECEPVLFERHYVAGATLVQEGKRTIIVPSDDSKTVTEIKPGQHLVARYVAENHNIRTHEVTGVEVQRRDGTLALDERIISDKRFSQPIAVPMHGDVFAVVSVLYGMTAEDKNHNGKIEANEWACEPIATKVDYVEFVPRGHELEAFLIGVGVGAIGGYFIPPIVVPGPSPEAVGTYTSGSQVGFIE